jgi:aminomethyltransferase
MVPFAGFEMPVLYTSIVGEHRAVRARAGLFDVSHMGEFRVRGPGALALAQWLFTNDVSGTAPGRARYGLLCAEDGGIVDDVTLYVLGPEEVLFCVNAANVASDWEWFHETHRSFGADCEICDESAETALLALQGPATPDLLAALLPPSAKLPRPWRFIRSELAGVPLLVAATGYTGERGFELYTPAGGAGAVWDAICAAGGADLSLAGLGARDTLRTEMAYPLYGHELDRSRNPIEAGLERFLAFGRGFRGEPALRAVQERGPEQRLVGLVVEGRQVARPGYPICGPDPEAGEILGRVTSGTYGPTVERSIAIGYVPAGLAGAGTRLHVEVRGRRVPCEVSETPFLRRKD